LRIRNYSAFLFVTVLLAGCGSAWVNLDDTTPSKEKTLAAEEKCQVVEKLRELQTQEMMIGYQKIHSETEEAKDELDEVYRIAEEGFNTEVNECMRSQGLKRPQ